MPLATRETYVFGEFELRPSQRSFSRAGRKVPITGKTFEVLTCLVVNSGRVVLKEELLAAVWPNSFVEEGNLSQQIFWVRKALEDKADYVVTVPGRGYQFTAQVQVLGEPLEEAGPGLAAGDVLLDRRVETTRVVIEESGLPSIPAVTVPRKRALRLGIAVTAVAAAGVLGWWLWTTRTVAGDHHEIVLAEFADGTGGGLSAAMNTALSIDLKQSPYLLIATDARERDTLKLMGAPAGQKLSGSVAREVCERLNDQAVVSGAITPVGTRYLVTLTATDCLDGKDLAQTKAIAKDQDGVLDALDSVAAEMRRRLGEPLRSLRRFDKPLLPKRTNSLAALRAYSDAHDLGARGRFQQSVPLFQRAIELDPEFAVAYADLGTVYLNLGERTLSQQYLTKAYELRDLTDEQDRLQLIGMYNAAVTGDVNASIRNYRTWTDMYPQEPPPLLNLANQEIQIGHHELALEPAKKGLGLAPDEAVAYILLSRAQLGVGQLAEAKATCRQAIAHKLDGPEIRGELMRAAFLEDDHAAIDEQVAATKGTPSEPFITVQLGLIAFAEGRGHDGVALFEKVADGYRKQGMEERAQRMLGVVPRLQVYLGEPDDARALLKTVPKLPGSTDVPVALAEVGQVEDAEALLRKGKQDKPQDTLFNYFQGPQIEAAIAMAKGKPAEAVKALQVAEPYDLRTVELMKMRGDAYLALRQTAEAEAQYRKVLAHLGVDALTPNWALAHLGLARCYALEGKVDESRKEYVAFFERWKHADADLPVMREAHAEMDRLPGA